MSKQSKSLLVLSVVATAAITANRFATVAGAQTGAAGNSIGVADSAAAIGERFPVVNQGTAVVEAGAAIAAGALVEADASGRAVTKAAGVTLGRLAPGESAAGVGNFVEVILFTN